MAGAGIWGETSNLSFAAGRGDPLDPAVHQVQLPQQSSAVGSVITVPLGTQGDIKCNCSAAVAGHGHFAHSFLL